MEFLNVNKLVYALFFGIGLGTSIAIIKWVKGMLNAKGRVNLLEIDIERNAIKDNIGSLDDAEILARANERNSGEIPSTDPTKK